MRSRRHGLAAMQLQTIHHVVTICSRYEVSKAFYTKILGFSILRETSRADRRSCKCDLASGPIQITAI